MSAADLDSMSLLARAQAAIGELLDRAGWRQVSSMWYEPHGRRVLGPGAALQRHIDYFADEAVVDAVIFDAGHAHETCEVRFEETAACIDLAIAPLVEKLWRPGLRTSESCEDRAERDWIVFESAADVEHLVSLVLPTERARPPCRAEHQSLVITPPQFHDTV